MSAVLLAVFTDFDTADRVRTDLVRDGFPTDRIDVTASLEPGRAGLQPGRAAHDRYVQYFRTLFGREDERACVERLVERIEGGAATVTVHPRGVIEASRAMEILDHGSPMEKVRHDLENPGLEHAAAKHEGAWVRNFWLEATPEYHCIYCRMFAAAKHSN
ncbi:MAG TPA: hypothetical protein VFO44_09160 [Steroidobacteraceae bacterium]|nr:hypothetical protein [Steroidobacteraceae bacterium]